MNAVEIIKSEINSLDVQIGECRTICLKAKRAGDRAAAADKWGRLEHTKETLENILGQIEVAASGN